MAQAIAIIHKKGRSLWLNDLLDSISTDYPIIITNHDGWMIDGVKKAFETTNFDEIFFLNESMIIKDNAIWDIVFKQFKGKSVAIGDKYLMCLGKYLRKYVEQTEFPVVNSKEEDVKLGEFGWNNQYMDLDSTYSQIYSMTDTFEKYEYKYRRSNMILENEYFKKWKGTWNI